MREQVSLVLLPIVCENEVLQSHLHTNPLLISQCGPNMVRLCNGGLVWLQNHLSPVSVDMQCSEDENESREGLGEGGGEREEGRGSMTCIHVLLRILTV